MHWHLDVTFEEDANKTIDKRAAENLNIIRKWCISILKMIFLPKGSITFQAFVLLILTQILYLNLKRVIIQKKS